MTAPAETCGARWLALGAILGLVASGLLVGSWQRSSTGLSVTVLGSGRQASVLITADHRRILIAAGTSGSAFSNAIGDALPPIDGELDLVLLDPGASLDVQERVRALAATHLWTLPASQEPSTAETIKKSFVVDMGGETRLHVRVEAEGSWLATLASPAGLIILSPDGAGASESLEAIAVAVITHETDEFTGAVPLIIGVPGLVSSTAQQVKHATPGSTIRLELADGEIRTNASAHQSLN